MQFYGLGEKHTPFERSGRAYWFWNTDVWADHPWELVRNGDYDPDYLSSSSTTTFTSDCWWTLLFRP